jgi:hypothetical protein
MEHFEEAIKHSKLNYNNTVKKLEIELNTVGFLSSPYDVIRENFKDWDNSFNYLSLNDLKESSGITKIISKVENSKQITRSEFIFYLEYVLFILTIPPKIHLSNLASFKFEDSTVYKIINSCLNTMNCKVIQSENGCFIVPKSGKVELATQITKKIYNLDEDLWMYNHNSIKNNLVKKADILCRLYKYLEKKKDLIKSYQYDNIHNDITKLMDGLDIRHAPNKKEEEILNGMSKKEVLGWYDQVFQMSVSVIILLDYTQKRKDIKELKGKLG